MRSLLRNSRPNPKSVVGGAASRMRNVPFGAAAGQRQSVDAADVRTPGSARSPRLELVVEPNEPWRRPARPPRRTRQLHGDEMIGTEAQVLLHQAQEAAAEQTGADEQHQRDRELHDDERAAQARARRRRRPACAAVLEARLRHPSFIARAPASRPSSSAVTTETANAKPSTGQLTPTSSSRGRPPGSSASSARTPAIAMQHAERAARRR